MIAPVETLIEERVPARMRDGATLYATVYRPAEGPAVPAILSRTWYEARRLMTANAAVDPEKAVAAGYALVVQDVRGISPSEGEFDPFISEALDGYDAIEWVAAQAWCDGSVMLSGRSYVGATQWLAAAEQPPSLKAIPPPRARAGSFSRAGVSGGGG